MAALLLDTHIWAWSLRATERLSARVAQALAVAEAVYLSPISFYEIGQKVRLGKWPEMASIMTELPSMVARQGGLIASLTPEVCLDAATLDWAHRDPFDRMLAATSLLSGIPLASADGIFDQLADDPRWRPRIW